MSDFPNLPPDVIQEVDRRLDAIKQDPTLFAPYDLDGDGRIDANEEERLRSFLTAQVRTERALRGEREQIPGHEPVTRVADRYVVIRELGAGGQARTYLALDEQRDEHVVIKELHLVHLENWKAIELFEREGQILSQLDHPDIPSYLGAHHEETEGAARFMLIQEYVEGPTLAELIASGRRFEVDEIKLLLESMLHILIYLQEKNPPVIHRDLKPSNIIQRPDGSWALIDFGAIQAVLTTASMIGSTIVGTSGYMAPEQFMGRSVPATDLYALGATAIHTLSHVHPAEMPLKRMRLDYHPRVNLSRGWLAFLDRLLDPNVEDRFDDAKHALEALEKIDRQLVQIAPSPAPAAAGAAHAPSSSTRAGLLVAIILSGLVTLGLGVAVLFLAPNPPEDVPEHRVVVPPLDVDSLVNEAFEVNSPKSPLIHGDRARTEIAFGELDVELVNKVSTLSDMTIQSITVSGNDYSNDIRVGIAITNGSKKIIDELKADVFLLDGDGERLSGKTIDVHQGYEPDLREGDMAHCDADLKFVEGADKFVVELVQAKLTEALPPPENTPVEIKWIDVRPEGAELSAKVRSESLASPSYAPNDPPDHDLALEVTNTGEIPLQLIKLEKRVYNKAGDVLDTDESYLNGVYDPPVDPGDTLLISLDSDNLEGFDRYEILVSDVSLP